MFSDVYILLSLLSVRENYSRLWLLLINFDLKYRTVEESVFESLIKKPTLMYSDTVGHHAESSSLWSVTLIRNSLL